MTGGSWLCLLAPLGGTILITLCGTQISRVAAAWIATTSCFVAFGGAVWVANGLATMLSGAVGLRDRRVVILGADFMRLVEERANGFACRIGKCVRELDVVVMPEEADVA